MHVAEYTRYKTHGGVAVRVRRLGEEETGMKRANRVFLVTVALLLAASGLAVAADINGTPRDDTLRGTLKADTIRGFAGGDTIKALAGKDKALGGKGADEIYGGDDYDELRGGPGADRTFGQDYTDSLYGDDGDDFLRADSPDTTDRRPDVLIGGDGDDTLLGGEGAVSDEECCLRYGTAYTAAPASTRCTDAAGQTVCPAPAAKMSCTGRPETTES